MGLQHASLIIKQYVLCRGYSIAVQYAKPLLISPVNHGIASLSHGHLSSNVTVNAVNVGQSTWVHATYMGDPGPWCWPDQVLALEAIWHLNQFREDICVAGPGQLGASLLCNTAFQINK